MSEARALFLIDPEPNASASGETPQPKSDPEEAEELVLSATRKVTLRCGMSSITLHPNGKIVLRGEYILSDAQGVNRIAGGRIELN